jgi:hypothetical protein
VYFLHSLYFYFERTTGNYYILGTFIVKGPSVPPRPGYFYFEMTSGNHYILGMFTVKGPLVTTASWLVLLSKDHM